MHNGRECILWSRTRHFGCMCIHVCRNAICELPTFLLGLGSVFPPARVDIPFGITFALTRIIYYAFSLFVFWWSFNEGLVRPVLSTLIMVMHCYWFVGWIRSYHQRRSEKPGARAGAAGASSGHNSAASSEAAVPSPWSTPATGESGEFSDCDDVTRLLQDDCDHQPSAEQISITTKSEPTQFLSEPPIEIDHAVIQVARAMQTSWANTGQRERDVTVNTARSSGSSSNGSSSPVMARQRVGVITQ
jgi:hypothetical protein